MYRKKKLQSEQAKKLKIKKTLMEHGKAMLLFLSSQIDCRMLVL